MFTFDVGWQIPPKQIIWTKVSAKSPADAKKFINTWYPRSVVRYIDRMLDESA